MCVIKKIWICHKCGQVYDPEYDSIFPDEDGDDEVECGKCNLKMKVSFIESEYIPPSWRVDM